MDHPVDFAKSIAILPLKLSHLLPKAKQKKSGFNTVDYSVWKVLNDHIYNSGFPVAL